MNASEGGSSHPVPLSSLSTPSTLMSKSTKSDLIELNSRLLNELQYYDLLTRELSTELESSLNHITSLQKQLQSTDGKLEDSQVNCEVLQNQRRREVRQFEKEKLEQKKQIAILQYELRRLREGRDGTITNHHSSSAATISTSVSDDFILHVSDSHALAVPFHDRSANGLDQVSSDRSPDGPPPPPPPARRRHRNRETRARMEPGLHVNGTLPVNVLKGITTKEVSEEDQSQDSDSNSDSSTTSSSSQDGVSYNTINHKSGDVASIRFHPNTSLSQPRRPRSQRSHLDDTLQLVHSIDGVDVVAPQPHPPSPPTGTNVAQTTLPPTKPSASNDAIFHFHDPLNSDSVPMSDYLSLRDQHTFILEKVRQLEDKLLDQHRNWVVYMDLMRTRHEAKLASSTHTISTQTPMILNTPSCGTLGELLSESIVYVTPKIWRAIMKARIATETKDQQYGKNDREDNNVVDSTDDVPFSSNVPFSPSMADDRIPFSSDEIRSPYLSLSPIDSPIPSLSSSLVSTNPSLSFYPSDGSSLTLAANRLAEATSLALASSTHPTDR